MEGTVCQSLMGIIGVVLLLLANIIVLIDQPLPDESRAVILFRGTSVSPSGSFSPTS
jgi:hypothetical protein